MKKALDFKNKTIRQIRLWALAAAVLPISALAAVFFVWRFMDYTALGYVMVAGEVVMFTVAVVWWWWALYVLRNLINNWDSTKDKITDVQHTISEIRILVREELSKEQTK